MRVVQAVHWLKDTLVSDRDRILRRLTQVLADPAHGATIRKDLIDGFSALPTWMQSLIRELLGGDQQLAAAKTSQPLYQSEPSQHASHGSDRQSPHEEIQAVTI